MVNTSPSKPSSIIHGWDGSRPGTTAVIVGAGRLEAELKGLTAELGLGDRVTFAGFVGADALRSLLSNSDLFVLTAAVNPARVRPVPHGVCGADSSDMRSGYRAVGAPPVARRTRS